MSFFRTRPFACLPVGGAARKKTYKDFHPLPPKIKSNSSTTAVLVVFSTECPFGLPHREPSRRRDRPCWAGYLSHACRATDRGSLCLLQATRHVRSYYPFCKRCSAACGWRPPVRATSGSGEHKNGLGVLCSAMSR